MEDKMPQCKCGSDMVLKNGKYSDYYTCVTFPVCRETVKVKPAPGLDDGSGRPAQPVLESYLEPILKRHFGKQSWPLKFRDNLPGAMMEWVQLMEKPGHSEGAEYTGTAWIWPYATSLAARLEKFIYMGAERQAVMWEGMKAGHEWRGESYTHWCEIIRIRNQMKGQLPGFGDKRYEDLSPDERAARADLWFGKINDLMESMTSPPYDKTQRGSMDD